MGYLSINDFEINGENYEQKSADIYDAQNTLFESLTPEQKFLAEERWRFAFATINAIQVVEKHLRIVREADNDQDRKMEKDKKYLGGFFIVLILGSWLLDATFFERLLIGVGWGVLVIFAVIKYYAFSNRAFNKITNLENTKMIFRRDWVATGISDSIFFNIETCEEKMDQPNELVRTQFENLHSILCYQIRIKIMKSILNNRFDSRFEKYL